MSPLPRTLQIHIPGLCSEQTHQNEHPAPLLELQGNVFGADTQSPSWQQVRASPSILCLDLNQGHTPATHIPAGTEVTVPWAKAVPSSCAEPNQSAPAMESCNLAFLPSFLPSMEGKPGWSTLWAGSSLGNAALWPGGHCQPTPSSCSHLVWSPLKQGPGAAQEGQKTRETLCCVKGPEHCRALQFQQRKLICVSPSKGLVLLHSHL